MKNPLRLFCWLPVLLVLSACRQQESAGAFRPNMLWITSEDMNAFLGAYGDTLAVTPNLDRLAAEGVRYTHAFATAPVCSPSRSCLITGVYASSLGTQHLRSELEIPGFVRPFPKILREAGYYCSNNYKEDYNFRDDAIWDESSREAHWRKRKEGQPFFSVFNIDTTHQSGIFGSDSVFQERFGRQLSETAQHDPDAVAVPPYHFDSPLVRKLWARYYDLVSIMDREAGEILQQLEEDGLAENTIVFFFADHGTGMPRSKRALYDSGLKVPLIIRAPQAWREKLDLPAGSVRDDLVSFVDFAPTLLSLLGIEKPAYMQGKAFLGPARETQPYVFGHADRVDEAYEISRTVRGKRYRYIRNYLPDLPLLQRNFYTDQSEIMKELRRLKEVADLTPAQAAMWQPARPPEELYDVQNDPFELRNLAGLPEYGEVLTEMRNAQKQWASATYDSGLLHESDMMRIAGGGTVYEAVRDPERFPVGRLLELTDAMMAEELPKETVLAWLDDEQLAVRFWAARLAGIRKAADPEIREALVRRLADPVASVRLSAAKALCELGRCGEAPAVILAGLKSDDPRSRLLAARTFEELFDRMGPIATEARAMKDDNCPQEDWNEYYKLYTCWALEEAFKPD